MSILLGQLYVSLIKEQKWNKENLESEETLEDNKVKIKILNDTIVK